MRTVHIDKRQLASLLRDFTLISGIRISFWDTEGVKLVSSADTEDSPFCSRLRNVPELLEKCRACDRALLGMAARELRTVKMRCHADLEECAYPVIFEGQLMGYFMIGQSRIEGRAGLRWAQAWHDAHGLDPEEMLRLYRELPSVPADVHQAAIRTLAALASSVCANRLVYTARPPLISAITDHVRAHLHGNITVADVCRAVGVSRSTLYNTLQAHTGLSLVQYVRHERVRAAGQLLRSGCTVQEAAEKLGFSSPAYFSRVFFRATGVRPSRFISQGLDAARAPDIE